MDDAGRDLLMKVEGMTCQGCVDAVTRVVRRLDPAATVAVDLDRGLARIGTRVESLDVAAALTAAGYEAGAATG